MSLDHAPASEQVGGTRTLRRIVLHRDLPERDACASGAGQPPDARSDVDAGDRCAGEGPCQPIDHRTLAATELEQILRTDGPARKLCHECVQIDEHAAIELGDRLLERVWGYDQVIETRSVDVHVGRLRAKLGSAGRQIETVVGLGYRFVE